MFSEKAVYAGLRAVMYLRSKCDKKDWDKGLYGYRIDLPGFFDYIMKCSIDKVSSDILGVTVSDMIADGTDLVDESEKYLSPEEQIMLEQVYEVVGEEVGMNTGFELDFKDM